MFTLLFALCRWKTV